MARRGGVEGETGQRAQGAIASEFVVFEGGGRAGEEGEMKMEDVEKRTTVRARGEVGAGCGCN